MAFDSYKDRKWTKFTIILIAGLYLFPATTPLIQSLPLISDYQTAFKFIIGIVLIIIAIMTAKDR